MGVKQCVLHQPHCAILTKHPLQVVRHQVQRHHPQDHPRWHKRSAGAAHCLPQGKVGSALQLLPQLACQRTPLHAYPHTRTPLQHRTMAPLVQQDSETSALCASPKWSRPTSFSCSGTNSCSLMSLLVCHHTRQQGAACDGVPRHRRIAACGSHGCIPTTARWLSHRGRHDVHHLCMRWVVEIRHHNRALPTAWATLWCAWGAL